MGMPPVQIPVTLYRFHMSPDAELPECICSLCLKPFTPSEDKPRCPAQCCPELETDGDCGCGDCPTCRYEDDDYDDTMPIRMFSEANWEARFHKACFEKVFTMGDTSFTPLPGIRLTWHWGDDEKGKPVVGAGGT